MERLANNATTTLNGAINDSQTSIVVNSHTGFPSLSNFRILIGSELMLVIGGAGTNTWTVTRGIESTNLSSAIDGSVVSQVLTVAGLQNTINQSVASPDTAIQYNFAGVFGGSSNLTWDYTNQVLDVVGTLNVDGQANTLLATTTVAIDFNNGNIQKLVLAGGDQTVTFANPVSGGTYLLQLIQPPSGPSGTVTWPTITWKGGTAPTLSTGSNVVDLISLLYADTTYYGHADTGYGA